jgi:hypothetical protein
LDGQRSQSVDDTGSTLKNAVCRRPCRPPRDAIAYITAHESIGGLHGAQNSKSPTDRVQAACLIALRIHKESQPKIAIEAKLALAKTAAALCTLARLGLAQQDHSKSWHATARGKTCRFETVPERPRRDNGAPGPSGRRLLEVLDRPMRGREIVEKLGITHQGAQGSVSFGDPEGAEQGSSVALSADGNTAIVGGVADGPEENGYIGAAWVYTRSGGLWTQQGSKLVGTGAVGLTDQGQSVALSAPAPSRSCWHTASQSECFGTATGSRPQSGGPSARGGG